MKLSCENHFPIGMHWNSFNAFQWGKYIVVLRRSPLGKPFYKCQSVKMAILRSMGPENIGRPFAKPRSAIKIVVLQKKVCEARTKPSSSKNHPLESLFCELLQRSQNLIVMRVCHFTRSSSSEVPLYVWFYIQYMIFFCHMLYNYIVAKGLSDSGKLWARPCRDTQDRQVIV